MVVVGYGRGTVDIVDRDASWNLWAHRSSNSASISAIENHNDLDSPINHLTNSSHCAVLLVVLHVHQVILVKDMFMCIPIRLEW